jgi:hypothetical protein
MRKIFSLVVVGLLFFIYACGGGGDNPESVMDEYFGAFEAFINDIESANSADEIVAGLNNMADAMQKLKPRMEAMQKKYPELKGMKEGKMPEKFKKYEERLKELMPKMMGLFGKIAQYGSDPKVVEAQKKWQELMK